MSFTLHQKQPVRRCLSLPCPHSITAIQVVNSALDWQQTYLSTTFPQFVGPVP